jgi:uncharacterized protein (DUF488 family)
MYWRQRVVIEFLKRSPKKLASRLQLVKWLFLLRHEKEFHLNTSFYDFFPHKYGPFSFQLYKDLSDMQEAGIISFIDKNVEYTNNKNIKEKLPTGETRSIVGILEQFGTMHEKDLLNYVYSEYPWYASRSVLSEIPHDIVDITPPAVYSLGYEGLSIDTFLSVILTKNLKRVIDVRNNPFSRKYGFSSSQLKEKCQEIEVEYYHFPDLGIPSSIRKTEKDDKSLWAVYEDKILLGAQKSLDTVKTLCCDKNSLLLCFEQDPNTCHRRILARNISVKTSLPVYHYEQIGNRWRKE